MGCTYTFKGNKYDSAKKLTDHLNSQEERIVEPTLKKIGDSMNIVIGDISIKIKPGVAELFESNPELANDVYEALGFKTKISENEITRGIKEVFPYKTIGNYSNIEEGLIGRNQYETKIGDDTYVFEISNYNYENEDGTYQSYYDIDFTVNGSEELVGTGFFDKSEKAKQIIQAIISQNYGNDTIRFNVEESKKGKQRLLLYKRLMNQLGYNPSDEMEYALFYNIDSSRKINLTPQQKQQAQQLYSQYLEQGGSQVDIQGFKEFIGNKQKINNTVVKVNETGLYQSLSLEIKSFVDKSVIENKNVASRAIIKKLKDVIPGIKIIEETKKSALENGNNPNSKGWIDAQGYHLNVETFTSDTMVHELTELWLYSISKTDPVAYANIMTKAEEHMANNPELVKAIKKSYGNITGKELAREYMATISGFSSVDDVNDYITYNIGSEMANNKSTGIFSKVREFFKMFDEYINRLFDRLSNNKSSVRELDLQYATFEDIVKALSQDAINGNSIFTQEEGNRLSEMMSSDTKLRTESFYSHPLLGTTSIENISDFDQFFTKDALGFNIERQFGSKRQRAEFFFHHMKNDDNGNHIYYKGKRYNFKDGETSDIIDDIESTFIPAVDKFNIKLENKIENFAKTTRTDEDLAENLITMLSDKDTYFTDSSLRKLYHLSGLALGHQEVIKYSELQRSNIPQLRALYNSSFFMEGDFDPLIIINKTESGKLYISLLDITSQPLEARNNYIDNTNLLGNIMSDREYTEKGGSLTNKVLGIRKFKLALLAAHLMKGDSNIIINNVSVFSSPTSTMKYNVISDISDLMKDLKIVGETKEISDNINDDYIKSLLKDERVLSMESSVSTLELLANYLDDKSKLKTILNEANEARINGRFADYDKTEMLVAIQRKMRELEIAGKKDSKLYELLSMTVLEYQAMGRPNDFMKNVADMNWGSRMTKTSWNIAEPVTQLIINQYMKAKTAILTHVKKAYKEVEATRNAYYNQRKLDPSSNIVRSKILNASSDVFKDMYQEKMVIIYKVVNGVKTKVREKVTIPFLPNINSSNEKIKAYALAIKEVYDKEIYDSVKAEMIRNGEKVTDEKIKKKIESRKNIHDYSGLNEFYIPVIKKTQAELMLQGITQKMKGENSTSSFKEAINRFLEESGNEHNMFVDVASEKEANTVTNKFKSQIMDFGSVLEQSGMKMTADGELEIYDENKFNQISTNIEMAMASFVLSNARARIFETQLMPVYNAGLTIIKAKGVKAKGDPMAYKNHIAYIEEYLKVLVERKSPDMESQDKWERRTARFVKASINLFSNSTLGLSLKVGVKSLLLLETHSGITALSNSMAKIGLSQEEKQRLNIEFINPKSLTKAHVWHNTYNNFGWTLARKLQQIDNQEMDILTNPVFTKTSRHAVNPGMLHILNKGGDDTGRIVSTIAYLEQNGSLDAYSYDKKTGEVSYDETKDKFFYDESGKIKPEMKAIRDQIWHDNVDTGLQDPNIENLQLGMSYKDMARVKSITDRWVIGSMSEDTRWQLNNHWAGKLVSTFRVFSDEKLFRAGLFANTRETILGTGYKTYTDEYGNELTYHDIKKIEGTIQSLGAFFREMSKLRNMDIKKFWTEAPHERRVNLMRTLVRGGLFLTLMLLFKAMVPDDDEEELRFKALVKYQRHYKFLYQDLMDLFTITEIARSPIPIYGVYESVIQVVFGDKDFKSLLRLLPGVSSGEWIDEGVNIIKAEMEDNSELYYQEEKKKEKIENENEIED